MCSAPRWSYITKPYPAVAADLLKAAGHEERLILRERLLGALALLQGIDGGGPPDEPPGARARLEAAGEIDQVGDRQGVGAGAAPAFGTMVGKTVEIRWRYYEKDSTAGKQQRKQVPAPTPLLFVPCMLLWVCFACGRWRPHFV